MLPICCAETAPHVVCDATKASSGPSIRSTAAESIYTFNRVLRTALLLSTAASEIPINA